MAEKVKKEAEEGNLYKTASLGEEKLKSAGDEDVTLAQLSFHPSSPRPRPLAIASSSSVSIFPCFSFCSVAWKLFVQMIVQISCFDFCRIQNARFPRFFCFLDLTTCSSSGG